VKKKANGPFLTFFLIQIAQSVFQDEHFGVIIGTNKFVYSLLADVLRAEPKQIFGL
jgi:hypothetical protein